MRIHTVSVTDCAPSWSWYTGDHGFSDYDLWTVLRGKGTLSAGGETRAVASGSSVLVPPHTPLIGTHDPCHPLSVIAVHFQFDEGTVCPYPDPGTPFLVREVTDFGFFRSLLQRTVRLYYSDREEDALVFFRTALAEFFLHQNAPPAMPLHAHGIWEICDRIDRDAARAPSLSALAAEYGYSADYLGRLFRQITGVTYSTYTANARVNKARELLATTLLSCAEIAEKLGYCDTAYFSRQFARVTGLPPGEYRYRNK